MNTIRNILDIVLFGLVVGLTFTTIQYCSRQPEVIEQTKYIHDTTMINVVDTVYYWNAKPIMILPIHDTIITTRYKTDTIEVEVPKVSKVYADSTYECQVSGGYFANLDYIKVYQNKSYITIKEKTEKKPKFVISLGITAGYDPCYNRMSYIIGIHGGIPIWNFYGKK